MVSNSQEVNDKYLGNTHCALPICESVGSHSPWWPNPAWGCGDTGNAALDGGEWCSAWVRQQRAALANKSSPRGLAVVGPEAYCSWWGDRGGNYYKSCFEWRMMIFVLTLTKTQTHTTYAGVTGWPLDDGRRFQLVDQLEECMSRELMRAVFRKMEEREVPGRVNMCSWACLLRSSLCLRSVWASWASSGGNAANWESSRSASICYSILINIRLPKNCNVLNRWYIYLSAVIFTC